MNVLIVDDDRHIREVIHFALEKAGHRVFEATDGQQALALFAAHTVDLVVLDIVLPELDGLEVCRKIRSGSSVPILFLSSRDEELDRVLGLELGGDDYMTKPFSPRELVARVKAIARRASGFLSATEATPESTRMTHGPLCIDSQRHACFWAEHEVVLTVTELAVLRVLLGRPGRVFTRGQLVDLAYGSDHHITDRTVDSHIRRIRHKLAAAGGDPVETVYGVGYRLREVL